MHRFILILFALLVVVGIVLAATGVLRFQSNADESTIILDKQELKEDSRKAVEKTQEVGGKALDKTGDALHRAAEGLRGSRDDKAAPPKKPQGDSGSAPQIDPGKSLPEGHDGDMQR